ncbi:bifunctional diguanylate cyclase/phosphodiesterase [Chitinilyticum litopenaei]|uniref:bifunctional diguanylate cyclase/phosphodiesterase n=1 Tax=Chitinilyticum litopenaei TaxID=1121276 RepID=UPI0003FCA6D5|nr:EAL domain-containing protein [Chitinilyticum litopenaei]
MSIYRQLWLVIATLMAIMFIGCFALNLHTARGYLEQQLYTQSNDSAAALALTMSQNTDPVSDELLISALFDSGHFQRITHLDARGKVVLERTSSTPPDRVPEWFIRLLPITPQSGKAQVTHGWKQAGSVVVEAHTRFAYVSLWKGFISLLLWMLAGGIAIGLLATLFLKWLKKPISQMVDQAQAITERRFITIPEPRTKELRTVIRAMNAMVLRVKAMFDEQAERIQQLRQDANRDHTTGLANRAYLMGRLASTLSDHDAPPQGSLLLIRLHDLAGINRELGRQATDRLLARLAEQLASISSGNPDWLAARLNGADFALLAPELDAADSLAAQLLAALAPLAARPWLVNIGHSNYQHDENPAQVLARTDAALARAEQQQANACAGDQQGCSQQASGQWEAQLRRAIADGSFELMSYPVLRMDGQLLHHEMLLRMLNPGGGPLLAAGQFMPYASRYNLLPQLDLIAVRLTLARLADSKDAMAVNLAPQSVRNPQFRQELVRLLELAGPLARRLWLEVSENGLTLELDSFATFAAEVSRYGCQVGIEHFGRQFGSMPRLYDLPLAFLKIDGSFIHEIDQHPGNQHMVQAMVGIARSLGILTIAEQVRSDGEWRRLQELGLDGATGPAAGARQSA